MTDRIPVDDLDTDYTPGGSPVCVHQGRPFTGVAVEMAGGRTVSETTYRDGMQSGPARTWYPDGRPESEVENAFDRPHGPFREWREDGTLRAEGVMELGHVVRRVDYDERGEPVRTYDVANDPEGARRLGLARRAFARLGPAEGG